MNAILVGHLLKEYRKENQLNRRDKLLRLLAKMPQTLTEKEKKKMCSGKSHPKKAENAVSFKN